MAPDLPSTKRDVLVRTVIAPDNRAAEMAEEMAAKARERMEAQQWLKQPPMVCSKHHAWMRKWFPRCPMCGVEFTDLPDVW